jgi:predicted porin
MKKFIFGLPLLASISVVHAQSSVTLYGVVDDALTFNSNAGGNHQYFLTSSGNTSSRWGLKGSEDLGGGLKAIFLLESGFSVNTGALGQGGDLFGRSAYVGLSSNVGTLTLGRQYSPQYWFVGPLTSGSSWAFSGSGYGSHPDDVDNLNEFNRITNSVMYTTPTIKGFSGQAMYSFGGVAGSTAEKQLWALGAGYSYGPLKLGIGYQDANQPNYSFAGVNANASTTANNFSSPVDAGYASAGAQKIFAAGAAYTFGSATVAATYSNTRFTDLGGTAVANLSGTEAGYRGGETFNIGELNFKYMLSPALSLGVAYAYTKSSGVNDARYQQVNLGFDYFLSKSTDIYGGAVYQHAGGTNSLGSPAVAAIAAATPSSNNHQTIALLGIGHRF